jgi:hypothetical protein
MKKPILFAIAAILLSTFIGWKEPSKIHQNQSTSANYAAALVVSQEQFNALTQDFQKMNGGATLGGMVSKSDLKQMILSIPSGDNFVNFRFAIDDATQQTSLMFMGGKSWYEGSKRIDCLRNGGVAMAFCPSNCVNNANETNVTLDINYETYNILANAYQRANPGKSYGGNIDKNALLEIIASLPESSQNVVFRFCKDTQFSQTSIIFIGGSQNQAAGTTLYLRNGGSAEAFCPSMCNVRN